MGAEIDSGIIRIGVDLGGTKIEAAALAPDGAVLARRRLATPRGDYPATIGAIADLVQQVEVETGRRGSVGVGIPGALSTTTGTIKNANSTWRSEEHTSELQSLMRISYAVFRLKKKKNNNHTMNTY